jgi:iron complex outermembrane receptor protein
MKRLLGIAVFAGIAVGAFAADVEIVVVASRIPEESRTTPAVVRVISEEDIERSDTVLDALSRIPSVRVVSSSPGDAYVSMGGFGENGFMRTLVLRDGVPLNNPDLDSISWRAIPLGSVERIEILQGPASAQYGDQAVAGVINIITADPDPGVSVEASASVDSNLSNEQALSLSYGAPEGSAAGTPGAPGTPGATGAPALGLRAEVSRSGYTPERERSDNEMWSAALTGTMEAGWFSGRLRGYYSPSSYQMPGALAEEQFEDDPDQASNDGDFTEQVEYGVALSPEASLGRLRISTPVSIGVAETSSDTPSFSSFFDSTLTSLDAGVVASYLTFVGNEVALTPTLGLDYRRSQLGVERYATEDRDTTTFEAGLTRNISAPWIRLKASVRDRIIIEAGARYEYAALDGESEDGAIDGNDVHVPIVADAGLSYLPVEALKLSVRYGRTFRYPALDEQVVYSGYGSDTFYDDLDPERGHSIVLGASYDEGTLAASAAPFVTWMADEIVFDSAEFRNFNTGETIRYGATLDASYRYAVLTLGAGYDYVRAEQAAGEHEGNVVPLVPAHSVTGEARARLPLGFTVGTDLRYTSSFYEGGDEANDLDMIPGRTAWDARLEWSGDFGLSTYIAARNILDDRTPTRVYYGGWYPMPARTYEVGARWKY